MFKKLVSSLTISLILATILPQTSFAARLLTFHVESSDGGTRLDFAPEGDDDALVIDYELDEEPDSVRIEIFNQDDKLVKNFTSTRQSDELVWNGEFVNKLVEPGNYRATIDVNSDSGDVNETRNFTVEYRDNRRPDITNFDVNPTTFDPDDEDVVIEFRNTEDADITVEIRDLSGRLVRSFGNYVDDNYDQDDRHEIRWDGARSLNGDNHVGNGTYKVVVVARNEHGVGLREREVRVSDSGGTSISSGNDHIKDINFNPKTTFNPQDDDVLEINFDVTRDLDELEVVAVRDGEEVEIYSDFDVERRSNLETEWDGRLDNGDYAEDGTWRIEFRSEVDDAVRETSKSIRLEYDEPKIKELTVSKRRFDPYSDETTFILFQVDEDAEVFIEVLRDNDVDDEIIDNWSVEGQRWYAVEWDGDRYDYDDDIDIKVHACVEISDEVCDSRKVSVDLAQDEVGSTRANITEDLMLPIISNGTEAFKLSYYLHDKADVSVTIHRGENGSGSSVTDKIVIEDQEAGRHELEWDGKDRDGDRLNSGFYSYRIESKLSGIETETGTFVIGIAGGLETANGSRSRYYDPYYDYYYRSGSGATIDDRFRDLRDGNLSGVSPGVIVDGGIGFGFPQSNNPFLSGFGGGLCHPLAKDVNANIAECEAISWVLDFGIFQGYPDGSFRAYDTINRAEALKVALGANNLRSSIVGANSFSDVPVTAWYAPYINTARNLGIFSGDQYRKTARPADKVNRAEAVKLLVESLRVSRGISLPTCQTPYSDVTSSAWYNKYACAAKQYKLVDGNRFGAADYITRAEMAEMLFKLFLQRLI